MTFDNPELDTLYRKMMNAHHTMAADDWKENVSDKIVARHAAEFHAAERAFLDKLDTLLPTTP